MNSFLFCFAAFFYLFSKNGRFQVKAAFATSLLIGSVCLFELMRAGVGREKALLPDCI